MPVARASQCQKSRKHSVFASRAIFRQPYAKKRILSDVIPAKKFVVLVKNFCDERLASRPEF
jgi:hypothetical protein